MRGPSPKPTAVQKLQGNPGRRPLNGEEPVTPSLSVTHPGWMDDDELARDFWYAVGNTVKAMNVAMESDRAALELLAMCLAEVRRAYDKLEEEGRTDYTANGGSKVSPYFTIMTTMIRQAVALMKEFGMTPAARSRVKALATTEKKSKLSKFIGGN